jgi:hypothetical protein
MLAQGIISKPWPRANGFPSNTYFGTISASSKAVGTSLSRIGAGFSKGQKEVFLTSSEDQPSVFSSKVALLLAIIEHKQTEVGLAVGSRPCQ